ncbi:MAG: glycosyltransferase [Candidatus Omnitrophota bacterium]
MGRRKKILILYISERSGHRYAASAVEKALKYLDAGVDILSIDGFNYTNPLLERVISRTYLGVIRRTPEVWDYLYDNPKVLKRVKGFREMIHRHNSGKLKTLLDEFRPDVIVCTQAFPCGMVADFKKSFSMNVPLIGVVTDYVAHSYWIFENVDFYIVPSSEARDKLIGSAVLPQKVKVYGIPVDPDFTRPCNKNEIILKLGLDLKAPVILVMGGSQGLGPLKKIITSLSNLENTLQIIIVTGTNKRLLESLKKVKVPLRHKVLLLGHVNNISELMDISTILVTKPGGITVTEAITKQLPMVIVQPLPGQEAKNTEFLLKSRLALQAESTKDLPHIISKLLEHPAQISALKERYKVFTKPNAAETIAQFVLDLAENYADVSVIQNGTSSGPGASA